MPSAASSRRTTASAPIASAPSADRLLAVLLILLQLWVLAYLSGARLFPLLMAALTLWGAGTRLRLKIEPVPLNLLNAALVIGFLLHYMFAPYPLPVDSQFIRSSLAHALARLLMAMQVLQLFLQQPTLRLPIWLAPCGAAALAFATNVRSPAPVHSRLLLIIAAFIMLFALYCGRSRRPLRGVARAGALRTAALAGALLLVGVLGSGSSWALQEHERTIEGFINDYLGYGSSSHRAGFNPNGRLEAVTAWRANGSQQIVLRIFSDREPGYLRGAVFDSYQGSSRDTSYTPWVSTSPRLPLPEISPSRSDPPLRPGDSLYGLTVARSNPVRLLDVWPEESGKAAFFTPLGTQTLAAPDNDLRADAHGVVSQPDAPAAIPYAITATLTDTGSRDAAPDTLTADRRAMLTSLDGPADPAVAALSTEIFAGCTTATQKIAAVQRYLQSNYEYRLGINIPHRMDPVTFFLTQRPGAHCEYFATGTAVLLRTAAVPCRYVVGFVAAEWNSVGGFWVARQKDAHAWVEAYDDARGRWVIVESTPAAGVPQPRTPGFASQMIDSLRHRLSIWRMSLRQYGLSALWQALFEAIWSIPGLVVMLGIVGAALVRHRPQWPQSRLRQRVDDQLRPLHRELARLDRQARRHGFERAPDETLSNFAARLRSSPAAGAWESAAADCYELYVQLRFRGRWDSDALRELQRATSQANAAKVAEQGG